MRVAVVGMGAVGHLIANALDGRAFVLAVDRWTAPLPRDAPRVDALLVTAKTPGTGWAAGVAAQILSAEGIAVTIQNGLGNMEILAELVGRDRVARGVTYVGAQLYADGSLVATGAPHLEIGQPPSPAARQALARVVEALRRGGVRVDVLDDLDAVVWRKLIVNCAVNPTTAILGCTHEELLALPTATRIADAIALETTRIARAAGVALTDEFALQHWRSTVRGFSANPRSSMLQDVMNGHETEVDAISGGVVREARRLGLSAPLNEAMLQLVGALHPKQPVSTYSFSTPPGGNSLSPLIGPDRK
jgi:2-dehydropantoate 2-reductase